jgi:hypothetical protein
MRDLSPTDALEAVHSLYAFDYGLFVADPINQPRKSGLYALKAGEIPEHVTRPLGISDPVAKSSWTCGRWRKTHRSLTQVRHGERIDHEIQAGTLVRIYLQVRHP